MFGLTTAQEAAAAVLDCCAGGSGFAAETAAARVVAADPAYALGRNDLADRVRAALHDGDQIIGANAEHFDWSWYGDPARRAELRTAAAGHFQADFTKHPGRYLAAALPNLPFAAGSFDLVLCSHLLFTWSDVLDADWHGRALAELIRVARHEVRVYPLVVQGTGQPVTFLDDLRTGLRAAGYRSRIQRVSYRFQKNADRMLVIEAS
jgi:SAM-dependent methyltransferase